MSAPIGSLRSPLPPHRRGKLKYRSPFTLRRDFAAARVPRIGQRSRHTVNEKPPLRERGRGTAKRWWGRKGIAACGIETPAHRVRHAPRHLAAPPTKPRAALKRRCRASTPTTVACCTTHKAACGIETANNDIHIISSFSVAPPTKPRAALKHLWHEPKHAFCVAAPPTKPRAALKHL